MKMAKKEKSSLLLATKKINKAVDILLGFMGLKMYVKRWACTCSGVFTDSPFHCLCYLEDDGRTVMQSGESLARFRRRIGCEGRQARLAYVTLYIEKNVVEKVADGMKIKIRGKRRDVFKPIGEKSKNQ